MLCHLLKWGVVMKKLWYLVRRDMTTQMLLFGVILFTLGTIAYCFIGIWGYKISVAGAVVAWIFSAISLAAALCILCDFVRNYRSHNWDLHQKEDSQ